MCFALVKYKFSELTRGQINCQLNLKLPGDIDNRIKTLLDALRKPKDISELPKVDLPGDGEDPF